MKAEQIWQAALGELQLQMTKATFNTWVKNTSVVSYEDGTFIIGVQNAYVKDWLENRLLTTIKRTLIGLVGHTVEVKFTLCKPSRDAEEPVSLLEVGGRLSASASGNETGSTLNPRYTFTNFIVGSSNRLAHAASTAVAENPATAYNPLFLYGGVGLGKTHLLHAVGHVTRQKGLTVLYVSSENFTNDLINSIRNHTTEEFREKYRSVDVLLVDDIQFIAGKESTQEEFFHTFNTLHSANKQIVMCSDRPPQAILTLEERLRSRFEWGLLADIQPPDLETRIAILRDKAEAQHVFVPDEVVDFIAHRVLSNIRELEGALNRVVAYANLMACALTPEVAAQALQDLFARQDNFTPDEILQAVAHYYGLEVDLLTGKGRKKEVVKARQMAMYLAREETKASLPQVGELLGGRDHTTVMYGHNKIASLVETDDSLRRDMLAIKEQLCNNGWNR